MASPQHQAAYYVLPVLSAIGFGGTVGLARINGLFKSILKSLRKPSVTLPDSQALLIKKWTYVKPIDNFLGFIITFFWPLTSGKHDTVAIQARHFMGQLAGIWLVIELEGARTTGVSSYLVPAGMAIQILGAATSVPAWTALQLLTATRRPTSETTLIAQKIAAVPYAVALGLFVPLIGMTITRAPSRKQFWIVMFQILPILTWIAGKWLKGRVDALSEAAGVQRIYDIAIALSTLSHLSSFVPSLLSQIAPGLFAEGKAKRIGPLRAFVPRFDLQDQNDMVEARLNFMRWDQTITVAAFTAWALVRTFPSDQGFSAVTSTYVLEFMAQSLVLGPVGAASLALKQKE